MYMLIFIAGLVHFIREDKQHHWDREKKAYSHKLYRPVETGPQETPP